jgi:hypothetical protein
MPVELAEGHLLIGAGLANDARRDDRPRDEGAAAHHRLRSEDRDQPVSRVDAVLQRDDGGLRPDYWADLLAGGLDVPQLDAQQDVINDADTGDIVRGLGRPDMGLAAIALYPQPVRANRREMGAARGEDHIHPRPGERGAIGPADTAGADHGEAHEILPFSPVQRSPAIGSQLT